MKLDKGHGFLVKLGKEGNLQLRQHAERGKSACIQENDLDWCRQATAQSVAATLKTKASRSMCADNVEQFIK